MIEMGSCVYPQTIQEHRKFIIDRPFQECFPDTVLQWSNIVHSHIKVPGATGSGSNHCMWVQYQAKSNLIAAVEGRALLSCNAFDC